MTGYTVLSEYQHLMPNRDDLSAQHRGLCMMPSVGGKGFNFMDGKRFCSLPLGHDPQVQPHVAYKHHDPVLGVAWHGPWADGCPDPRPKAGTTVEPPHGADKIAYVDALRTALRDVIGDESCPSHAEFQESCPTCSGLRLLDEGFRGWYARRKTNDEEMED